jgi:CRP-like cAMP-binding protein
VFRPEAEDFCLARAKEMTEVYGYAADVPLVTLSDFRKKLARISAAIAAVMVSANEDFTCLVVLPEHVAMAAEFLTRVYSHDNCSLDDYSEIQQASSQLLDYEETEKAFLEKHENEKHDPENGAVFPKAIFTLRVSDRIRREDLAEQVGCTPETVSRMVRLLKRFTLIETTPQGYVKKPKFNKFIRRFVRAHPEFFGRVGNGRVTS